MTRSRLRTLGRAFVPFTPRTHDLRYDRDVGESGLSPVSSAGPPRGRTIRLTGCIPRISPQSLWCVLVSQRRPAELQRQEPVVRIGNCDVRRGRTSPPDDCVQTSVTWRRTQSSITKYVLVPSAAPTPGTSPPAEGPHRSNGPSNKPGMPRTHHRARGLTLPGSVLSPCGASSRFSQPGPPHAHPRAH